jgi:hypothetical protein
VVEDRRPCLLPYSPDLNPIDEAFSNVKVGLRRTGARSRTALLEALATALSAVTSRDARGFFEHCGYRQSSQPVWQALLNHEDGAPSTELSQHHRKAL